MSLQKQALSGVVWSFFNLFLTRGAAFVSTVFLAKILEPDDFGLLGMITIFMGIGTTLADTGLSTSLIRSVKVDDRDYSTVFYTNLLLSVVIYIIIFLIAPYVSVFYNQPTLTDIIRVYCIGFIISATVSIQNTILTKDMEFKKLTQYQMPATVVSIICGISLAYLGYGVWSLVWMFLINQTVRSLVFWYKASWKPILVFDTDRLKTHFEFGYKLTLSSLLNTGFKNIYNILIGKYYAISVLGFFERSQTFQHYIVSTMTSVLTNVSYPLLSKIQDDKEKLVRVFKKVMTVSFFVIAPIMLGLSVVAKPLFLSVLGEKWLEAVPFFQILCVSGVMYPLHFLNINLLKVLGRSDLFLKLEIYKKIVLLVVIAIAFQYGIYGLLLSSIFSSLVGFFINTYYSGKLIDYGSKKQLIDLLPIMLLAILMCGIMYFSMMLLHDYHEFIQLVVPAIVGSLFYLFMNYLFKLRPIFEVLNIIKNRK
ncbi:lipopolysaccharide biosynthesis protein [Flavicella sediminum]|uniref:lipopolysaccharide biosynthesis protein n=1 Tax=Flavicella sediminum TaxID=2585141 RepID=UPI001121503F|nr:lipopolysaccharide biosynthesis protein [Flavicella sediminum]